MIEIKPYIIGCGGVASYLIPVLIKSFHCTQMWLRDGDLLEAKNIDRQLFDPKQIGQPKVEAMLKLISKMTPTKPKHWKTVPTYMDEGEAVPEDADIIICVADNHTARRAALQAAEMARIPLLIGCNEYYDSQAFYVRPNDIHTRFDPSVRYPEIATDTANSPIRCTGEALESTPQLAIANFRCASHILDLMWMHLHTLPNLPNALLTSAVLNRFPLEIFTAINQPTYIRYEEIN